MRLDVLMVQKGVFSSRELAKVNIKKGNVLVNGVLCTKPSFEVSEDVSITLITENVIPYVSRGGLKLEKALKEFEINCKDFDVLDIGASTGGFTDCVLQHGARRVYAMDVGTGQLSPTLKDDLRVKSIENTHIKDLTCDQVDSALFDLIVADLSFISLTKVLEFFPKFLKPTGKAIVLIKPQFEVGASFVGKGGIVKDRKAHEMAIANVFNAAIKIGLYLTNITPSPIQDERKNVEFLALLEQSQNGKSKFGSISN
jgi:23S rRNA (cytidine1920-2'-O)/16S rRNA (cytidine1409-2'-O)-methyltransferase